MSLKINVPYSEKDSAKSKGAFWNIEQKSWFVPDHKDINDFLQWIDTKKISTIAKSFFIGVNSKQCYKCAESTTVIALASSNFYYLDYDEQEDNEKWFQANNFSFFSMPVYINEEVTNLLNRLFPYYKLGYSRTVGSRYWANHCKHCGALQGDFYLHFEPSGAFFPVEIEDYKKITLIPINTKFYVELNADISWASNADEIFDYANSINLEKFLSFRETKTPQITISSSNDNVLKKNMTTLIYWVLIKVKSFFN